MRNMPLNDYNLTGTGRNTFKGGTLGRDRNMIPVQFDLCLVKVGPFLSFDDDDDVFQGTLG